ncbi:MAG: N-acetylmuramoyl-L-alanine amidase [Crocinitomicaceae bacterium]
MRLKTAFFIISILLGTIQTVNARQFYPYQQEFSQAYLSHPEIPTGLLEAISFTQSRINDIQPAAQSCIGLPQATGVFGLISDGQGYFKNTRSLISQLANVPLSTLNNPSAEIAAYAKAYASLMTQHSIRSTDFQGHEYLIRLLSEIPEDGNAVNNYALSAHSYQVLSFLRDEEQQAKFGFPSYDIDLKFIYGTENYKILSAKRVMISQETITNKEGARYSPQDRSADYGPALWTATPSCNFSSRNGTPVSAVTVHTIQGSYAGAISWAQNCNSNVSYHYVLRSSDGQITQMVYEADKAWHVGSENPYTIGLEHEGYVDDPSWYTVAMYTSSAALVKDITQSGYGINPLRTFQGPATTGTNTIGGCTKIKGHQHYPNQSHTDPGINWNWEYYYQLINDSPPTTLLSTASGVFYDSGGTAGNYSDDERELYLIEPANAVSVTINFDQFSLESNWDYMYVYDGNSLSSPLLGVYTGTSHPGTLTSSSGSILIEFRSDCATQDIGWEISWTSVTGPNPNDVTPPSTSVTVSGNWQTSDFSANFTDADDVNGSGVQHQLYQVIHFDGTAWRANANEGFFSDNFDQALHADWTQQTGTWATNSGVLNQTDESLTNTNLHTPLDQDNFDKWLYHFAMRISGAGGNKRAGFHFMCDDATLTNRGNSYFAWFRSDDDKIQIYKTVNDVFQLEADIPYTINDNQWYDVKLLFDKTTGVIQLWLDGVMAASWTDPSPYTTGNAISFRSGDAALTTNNLKVYHERGSTVTVTVGVGAQIEHQNPDPFTASGKVKSIAIDSSLNISSVAQKLVNVDWTPPAAVSYVNDGTAADIAITTTNTELSANWASTFDQHSDLASYWYAIGSSPGATDVVNWTDNWFDTTVTHSGLNLTVGTTYYFSVYAENGAGLNSDTITSDGQILQEPTGPPTADFIVANSYICSFEAVSVSNSSIDAQTYSWSAPGATPSTSIDANPYFTYTANGYYDITLIASNIGGSDTTTQTIYVSVDTVPTASYTPSDTLVDVSNAYVSFTNQSQHANGYVWNFDDGTFSTDVNPWYLYTATGIYEVMLIAVNGNCPNDTTTQNIHVVDDLSLPLTENASFEIYPNPASSNLNIQLGEGWGELLTLEIMDGRGRLVYSAYNLPAPTGEIQLSLSDESLQQAYYFVRLTDGEKIETQKILFHP